MATLKQSLRSLVAQWKRDEAGCRSLARRCARSEEYAEAASFISTATAMGTVIRDIEGLLATQQGSDT